MGFNGSIGSIPIAGSLLKGVGLIDDGVGDQYREAQKKAEGKIQNFQNDVYGASSRMEDNAANIGLAGQSNAKGLAKSQASAVQPLQEWQSSQTDASTRGQMQENNAGAATKAASQRAASAAGSASPIQQYYNAYGGTGHQAEQFFAGAQSGDDPYYDQMSKKTSQAMDRAAIARGQFNSGRAMRANAEAQSNLRAQQYNKMADMASSAQGLSNQSAATNAGIANQATQAQQDANALMATSGAAADASQRDWYSTLAGLNQSADAQKLSRAGNLSSLQSGNAKTIADLKSLYDKQSGDTTNSAIGMELQGLGSGLEAYLQSLGFGIQGAQADSQQGQKLVNTGLGIAKLAML